MPVSDDAQHHPRFKEWLSDCETLKSIGTLDNHLLPFHLWLKDKEEQELKPTPRIRGENPPAANCDKVSEIKLNASLIAVVAFFTVFMGIMFFARSRWPGGDPETGNIAVIAFAALGALLWYASNQKFKETEGYSQLFQLEAYNTEFTSPLADRSTLRITVHFQIPRELNKGTSTAPSYFVEQLNRVTEAKLITYTQTFTEPPTRVDIENRLHRDLLQFQNENNVAILRVDVPIAIHVRPDKPKGVNV